MLAMQIKTDDWNAKLRQLAQTPDLIRKSVVGALSETVDDLLVRQRMEMDGVFNNPTPYIKKGIKGFYPGGVGPVRASRKGRTGANANQAGTYFEFFPIGSSPEDIVIPHVFGGRRRQKNSERRLIGIGKMQAGDMTVMGRDYPKNNSGDIAGARYTQMLNELGALSDVARSYMPKSRQKNRKGTSYYMLTSKSGTPVIVERNGKNTRIMLVVAKPGKGYTKKYKYFEIGEKQVQYSLPIHFQRIVNRYISRM